MRRCICNPGAIGIDCGLILNDYSHDHWIGTTLTSQNLGPRAGHAGIYIPQTKTIWVFGGKL